MGRRGIHFSRVKRALHAPLVISIYKMAKRKGVAGSKKKIFVGRGGGFISKITNRAIDSLPFEAHLKGYNFCGPGTRLQERLARGDKGINPLDEACKLHDIAYATYKDSDRRRIADKELAERAWARVKSTDAKFGEKAAAWLVTTSMKAKAKIGGGGGGKVKKRRSSRPKHRRGKGIGGGVCKRRRRKNVRKRRKTTRGGVIPLLPIFAGLSALGSLAGGASAVAKVITDSKNAGRKLQELKRHNMAMEGKGLYIRPYKSSGNGYGTKKKRRRTVKKKKL